MKKLLLIIPFVLIGCVSPEQQGRNLQIMQGMSASMESERQANQAAYQQNLDNQQRQQMIDLQRKQLQQQSGSQTYSVTDEKGNTKVCQIKKDPYSLGR